MKRKLHKALLVGLAAAGMFVTTAAPAVVLGAAQLSPDSGVISSADSAPLTQSDYGPGYYTPGVTLGGLLTQYKSLTEAQKEFLNKIKPLAIEGWTKYKVLPSITGAQAIIESTWGTSGLVTKANNLFGIKGTYNGQSVEMPTQEYVNGEYVTVNAQFRKYPSWEASVLDHGAFLNDNSRYASLLGDKDYSSVAKKLQAAGYATSPTYASSLISIIESDGLHAWDTEALEVNNYNVIEINYAAGYGVDAYDSSGKQIGDSNAKFLSGTRWKAFGIVMLAGEPMYKVSDTEYIPMKYTQFNKAITINYAAGYGVLAFDNDGNTIADSNAKFKTGTAWKWFDTRELDGKVQFRVSDTEWIPAEYTIGGGYVPKTS
jgi:hypothetical protein